MTAHSPRPAAEVLRDLGKLRALDPPTHGGKVLSYVYDPAITGLDELIEAAVTAFLPVNGLDPTTFASVAVLERNVIAFARQITHGDEEVVGSVTSGGTESCLLAVKTARDLWRQNHTGRPTLVAPSTVHAAFHKACDYFDLEMIPIEVDPASGKVPPELLLETVDSLMAEGNPPALVVLSAPNYPIGAIDPIAELAPELASRQIPVHVDACVGGFVLPFYPEELPAWDFQVEGVTSISMDAHKYGYAPKGVSILLHRGRSRHHAQYFACVSWPGYPVVNPTILGSKSATALAASWAIIQHLGEAGYREATKAISVATAQLHRTLGTIEGLRILGEPFGPLIAVAADQGPGSVDPFNLIDVLRAHGFIAQAQPAFGNLPRTAHLTITPVSARVVTELGQALRAAADEVRAQPVAAADFNLLAQVAQEGLPQQQATVMATLEALPPEVARPALIGVLAAVIDPDLGSQPA